MTFAVQHRCQTFNFSSIDDDDVRPSLGYDKDHHHHHLSVHERERERGQDSEMKQIFNGRHGDAIDFLEDYSNAAFLKDLERPFSFFFFFFSFFGGRG